MSWHDKQVEAFRKQQPTYAMLARKLHAIFAAAVKIHAPEAIVQAREKTIASFSEKIQRKRSKYRDPVNQLTDLAGARVVAYTQADVAAVCRFIESEKGFRIEVLGTTADGDFLNLDSGFNPGLVQFTDLGNQTFEVRYTIGDANNRDDGDYRVSDCG